MFKYIHTLLILRGLTSLEGKNKLFVGKKEEKAVSQTQVRQTIVLLSFRRQAPTFCNKKEEKTWVRQTIVVEQSIENLSIWSWQSKLDSFDRHLT